jgi:hypothetical protein
MMPFRFRKRRKVVTVGQKEVDTKEVLEVDMDVVEDEDMEEVEEDHPLVLIVVR